MKLPEYTLKQTVSIPNSNNNDVLQFAPGTLVQPFWNEGFLPEHIKAELDEIRKFKLRHDPLVMCQIGMHWVPIETINIRETRFD